MTSTTQAPIPTTFYAQTSIFTPPSGCNNSFTFEPSEFNGQPSGLFVQNAIGGLFTTSCFPKGFTQAGRNEKGATVLIYSPGYCPDGYSTALLAPGRVTTATCCLSGYSYTFSTAVDGERAAGGLAGCISTFSSTGSTTVKARPSNTLTPNTLLVTSTLDGAALGQVTMWAQPITIAFQPNDLSLFTSSSASPGSRMTISSSSTNSPSPTASPSQHLLSTGARTGIGVGVAVAILSIIGIFLALLFRRRRRKVTPQVAHAYESNRYTVSELDGQGTLAEMEQEAGGLGQQTQVPRKGKGTGTRPGRVYEMDGSGEQRR